MSELALISDNMRERVEVGNVEAEAALLGALMIDNRVLGSVAQYLCADDFLEPLHGEIYDLVVKLVSDGRLATPITMRPYFDDHTSMTALGGSAYLAQLSGNSAALIGAKDFARQISDMAKRRALLTAFDDAREAVLDFRVELADTVADIDGAMSLAIRSESESKSRTMARAWDSTMESVDALAAGTAPVGWWIDGLADFNDLLGGMRAGNLIVLAGRPGMGKTAIAQAVAVGCGRAGIGCDFFTLEMSEEELMERVITDVCFDYDLSTFTYKNFQRGKLTPIDRQRIAEARAMIDTWPLRFYEPPSNKVGRIIMEMRRRKRAATAKGQDLSVFIIDYLQLLCGDKDRDNEVREISDITRALKLAAKELGVSIVLLSQLNRSVESREDKRPLMSDLRGSGSIEQDADAIIFIYREQYYLEASEPAVGTKGRDAWEVSLQACRDRVDLIARKVRKGSTGTRQCQFFLAHQAVRGSKFFQEIRR